MKVGEIEAQGIEVTARRSVEFRLSSLSHVFRGSKANRTEGENRGDKTKDIRKVPRALGSSTECGNKLGFSPSLDRPKLPPSLVLTNPFARVVAP